MQKCIIIKYIFISFLFIFRFIFSQSNNLYYHDDPGSVYAGSDILISQLMFTQYPISSGMLFFRNKGELSYQEMEMYFEGGRWKGIIPGDRVTIKGIEYVTILTKLDGGRISLPLVNNPFENPNSISVLPKQKSDNDFI